MSKPPFMTDQARAVSTFLLEHARTSIEGCHCGWAELGESHYDHVAREMDKRGMLVRVFRGLENHELLAETHDGFTLLTAGNEKAIDKLKELLIPNREVKWLSIYRTNPIEKLLSHNYTQLKALRDGE